MQGPLLNIGMLIMCYLPPGNVVRKGRVDELSLLNRLTSDENGIDEKAVAHFKHIYCSNE